MTFMLIIEVLRFSGLVVKKKKKNKEECWVLKGIAVKNFCKTLIFVFAIH